MGAPTSSLHPIFLSLAAVASNAPSDPARLRNLISGLTTLFFYSSDSVVPFPSRYMILNSLDLIASSRVHVSPRLLAPELNLRLVALRLPS